MNLDKALVELVRKIVALGFPAIVLVIVMATTGLTGAAAITSALAFLGGPAGMLGGILALGIMGLIADKLAQYGLDFLLMMIYQEKVNSQPERAEEEIVKEIDNLPVISNELKSKLKGLVRQRFTFMLIGRTGVGKSSTINRLLGEELAKVGAYEATTMDVEKYQTVINGVKFDVLDTPGLCDDEEEIGNDFNYLESQVTATQNNLINFWLKKDKTVIVDNTHLKQSYINYYDKFGVEVRVIYFDVLLKEALTRDMGRNRKVGEDIINRQYSQYINLRKT